MRERATTIAVVVLAGGEATRLPGKLFLTAGELPLLVRVVRNVSAGRETFLSCKEALPYEIDGMLDVPIVIDRWPQRGPLSGLLSALSACSTEWVFAVAGDAPFVDSVFIDMLATHIADGDEAIVPRRQIAGTTVIEPLTALYRRDAFLREGLPVLLTGDAALRTVVGQLETRFVNVTDAQIFTNVNTADDYAAIRTILS